MAKFGPALLSLLYDLGNLPLKSKVLSYWTKNFYNHAIADTINFDLFEDVVKSPSLVAHGEFSIVDAVVSWLEFDRDCTEEQRKKLLFHIQ